MKRLLVLLTPFLCLALTASLFLNSSACTRIMEQETGSECEMTAEQPDEVVMYGKRYTAYQKINGIKIYRTEDRQPEDHVIAAIGASNLRPDMSPKMMVLTISQYIDEHLEYDDEIAKQVKRNKDCWKLDSASFTSVCITKGKAVCAGYADLFQKMCQAVGIETWYIKGYVENREKERICHAWNEVVLDGMPWYVDTCWYAADAEFRWLSDEPFENREITGCYKDYQMQ